MQRGLRYLSTLALWGVTTTSTQKHCFRRKLYHWTGMARYGSLILIIKTAFVHASLPQPAVCYTSLSFLAYLALNCSMGIVFIPVGGIGTTQEVRQKEAWIT